eukprot:TRINITY_DN3988_c0_g1_i12.p2 TRINITY_DN3988_c0_g1~~TRINITY_DN3988_c0_g1_i12.p2  ORF type:complete len:106 (-),score=2.43 TRINITY_DN3988_c0_g1_i12:167-484(-)
MHVTSISSEIDWSRLQHVQRATKANERNMCLSLRPSTRSHLPGSFASANDHRFQSSTVTSLNGTTASQRHSSQSTTNKNNKYQRERERNHRCVLSLDFVKQQKPS